MVDEGVFILREGSDLDDYCKGNFGNLEKRNREKKQTEDAGVKTQGTNKYALIFMAYTKLDLGKGAKESAVVYFSGPDEIIGIIRNPLWSGKVPVISQPVDRVKGSFFGKSKVEPVKFLQWQLCDFWNMGQDSAMYSLLPIWAVDPLAAPQWATLVMGLAAVWPVDPNKIKPMTSPQLWKDSAQICDLIKRQIWESMDVNEMMMGKLPAGRKNNQLMGQMQQEQSTNISDHADRYEEEMLSPLAEMLFEFDQQFREDEVMIESRGEIGVEASVKTIPVQQWGERIFFRWIGSSFMTNMQRMQQQIAWLNVLKGIPPQMLDGRRLNLAPILDKGKEDIRSDEVMIESRGEIGVEASVKTIPVQQWGERIFFRWIGSSFMTNMQRMQQQIAWLNVLKGIPPQMLDGRRLNLAPILDKGKEDIFGPELAPKILVDERNMFVVDPDTENEILHNGMTVTVHEADDDPKHIQ